MSGERYASGTCVMCVMKGFVMSLQWSRFTLVNIHLDSIYSSCLVSRKYRDFGFDTFQISWDLRRSCCAPLNHLRYLLLSIYSLWNEHLYIDLIEGFVFRRYVGFKSCRRMWIRWRQDVTEPSRSCKHWVGFILKRCWRAWTFLRQLM